jgi:hypothetical protein
LTNAIFTSSSLNGRIIASTFFKVFAPHEFFYLHKSSMTLSITAKGESFVTFDTLFFWKRLALKALSLPGMAARSLATLQ